MPRRLKLLAAASGAEIYEDGPDRVVVYHRGGNGLAVALFVVGLVSLILLANGGLQIYLNVTGKGGHLMGGILLLGGGAMFAGLCSLVVAKRKALRKAEPKALPMVCALDFEAGTLDDHAGRPVAGLDEVRLARRFQLTSSSRALVFEHPGGRLRVARGSPFAGGIAPLEQVLEAKGIAKA
jgi:hypothetical protein